MDSNEEQSTTPPVELLYLEAEEDTQFSGNYGVLRESHENIFTTLGRLKNNRPNKKIFEELKLQKIAFRHSMYTCVLEVLDHPNYSKKDKKSVLMYILEQEYTNRSKHIEQILDFVVFDEELEEESLNSILSEGIKNAMKLSDDNAEISRILTNGVIGNIDIAVDTIVNNLPEYTPRSHRIITALGKHSLDSAKIGIGATGAIVVAKVLGIIE
jgi:hypothetical protein